MEKLGLSAYRCAYADQHWMFFAVAKTLPWVRTLRDSIADAGYAQGWSVLERNGKVQLQHSWLDPEGVRRKATAMLETPWERGCTNEVLDALEHISAALGKGNSLKQAASLYCSRDLNSSTPKGTNWQAAFEKFRSFKINTGEVSSERAFDTNDGRRWKHITAVMAERHPQNAAEIFEMATFKSAKVDGEWEPLPPGSKTREKKVQMINQLLRFCRDELGFDSRWHPPANYTKFKGKPQSTAQGGVESSKADPFPDAHAAALMASFKDTKAGRRWKLAVGLLLCFGLRPWELRFLRVEGQYLRVTKGKRNSSGQNPPRIVLGIDPEQMPGLAQQLLQELESGETELPPMGNHIDSTARLVNQYLRDGVPYWNQLKQEMEARGAKLSGYSFRHRYAKAADDQGISDRYIAKFMGNSRKVFVDRYGDKADEDALRSVGDRVMSGKHSEAA